MTTFERVLAYFGVAVEEDAAEVEVPGATRKDLALLFAALGFRAGAEVGTERGVYAKMLLTRVPGLTLHCVDPWRAYPGYREHVDQESLDRYHAQTVRRLAPYDARIVRDFSPAAAAAFEDGGLDFVYIDANHEFSHVVADLAAWAPKVRPGGIVAGHDFLVRRDPALLMHVPHAVRGHAASWGIRPVFILGRKDAPPGERRDKPRSWFWVVE